MACLSHIRCTVNTKYQENSFRKRVQGFPHMFGALLPILGETNKRSIAQHEDIETTPRPSVGIFGRVVLHLSKLGGIPQLNLTVISTHAQEATAVSPHPLDAVVQESYAAVPRIVRALAVRYVKHREVFRKAWTHVPESQPLATWSQAHDKVQARRQYSRARKR